MTIKERLLLESAKDLLKQIEDSQVSKEIYGINIAYIRSAIDQYTEVETSYNWKSTGPSGCDSHSIDHPCALCFKESIEEGE